MSAAPELLFFNGINASRGEYAQQPLTVEAMANLITGGRADPSRIEPDKAQQSVLRQRAQAVGHLGVKEGVREDDLASAGWAVVFPANADYTAVREALAPLLQLRQSQAGERYRELLGPTAYRPGESVAQLLARQGVAQGPVDPTRFPYYVLLVGAPDEIPFRFQYQLDAYYAVGRLHLPTLAAYANYARSVVVAEQGEVSLPRRAVFFAPINPDDRATAASAGQLVAPIAASLGGNERARDWEFATVQGQAATKARLAALLGGPETPALIFTAGHGVEFDPVDPRQTAHQGAILCQDWPGPRVWAGKAIPPDFYLAGDDIANDANLLGTVTVHFGSFSAGAPMLDDFPHQRVTQEPIAPRSFVAGLPQRLLGHPRGGALAVVGQVGRLWGSALTLSDREGARLGDTFASSLRRVLLAGAPVGWAVEFFNDRYAELATALAMEFEDIRFGKTPDPREIARLWAEHNDARGLMLLGDPAVRLPLVKAGAEPATRATIPEVRAAPTESAAILGGVAPDLAGPASVDPDRDPGSSASAAPGPEQPAPAVSAAAPGPPPGYPGWPTSDQTGQVSFGVAEWLHGGAEPASVSAGLRRELEEKVFAALRASLDEGLFLEVSTSLIGPGGAEPEGRLVARTRLDSAGDVVNLLAEEQVASPTLLELHARIVELADSGRTTRLTALANLLITLRRLE